MKKEEVRGTRALKLLRFCINDSTVFCNELRQDCVSERAVACTMTKTSLPFFFVLTLLWRGATGYKRELLLGRAVSMRSFHHGSTAVPGSPSLAETHSKDYVKK